MPMPQTGYFCRPQKLPSASARFLSLLMSASCTMLPDLSPQTTRAFADVTHHAVAGHAAIGQILISFVEDGKLMVSDDLSEEELDDLGLAGEITVEFLEAHKFYLTHAASGFHQVCRRRSCGVHVALLCRARAAGRTAAGCSGLFRIGRCIRRSRCGIP